MSVSTISFFVASLRAAPLATRFIFILLAPLALGQGPGPVTDRAIIDYSLQPIPINFTPGNEYSDSARDFAMARGIERTVGGRIWAAWVAGGDNEYAYIVTATSDNQGVSWSTPRFVIDSIDAPDALQRRARVCNFWTDPTGKLWFFYEQSMGSFDGRGGLWAITSENPDAATPTWSEPKRIWHGSMLNKPLVLRNGDWLLPITLWDRFAPGWFKQVHADLAAMRMAHVFVSRDQGRTWNRRGGVRVPNSDFDEHMLVELRDERLWLLARTKYGIAESFSSDAGATWSEPKLSKIKHVSSRFFIRRLASQRLLLVKHGAIDELTSSRSKLMAFLSEDDGATWSEGLMLDERDGVSYPDGFQAPDGSIYIAYDRNRSTDCEILFARFTEADIKAGKFISEGSRPMMLLSKASGGKQRQ